MSTEQLLDIEQLNVSFGTGKKSFHAVKNLDLSVSRSKCIGIVGESGSGKSVSSLSILGLLSPNARLSASEFQFALEGESVDLQKLSDQQWTKLRGRHIAMVFQEPMSSLNPVMKCGAQITEALRHHFGMSKTEAKQKTLSLFSEVLLPDPERAFNAYPHELSGGQKQRVMIAMALSCDPDLLIADEPTTALDVTVQKTILDLLKQLMLKRSMGMIFITHDLGVVAHIADEIAVMNKGELVERGTTQDLLHHPKHPYTKGLLACRPQIGKRMRYLPTVSEFMQSTDHSQVLNNERYRVLTDEVIRKENERLQKNGSVLEVNGLSVHFQSKKNVVMAVDDVSFNVFRGETLGLVGESGCGKSTLSRAILGLQHFNAGEVIYSGQSIFGDHPTDQSIRKKMQLIFQDPMSSLNPGMSVGNMLLEPMIVHGIGQGTNERKERVAALLKEVGLPEDAMNRYPHEFSGGQRQRIVIARALAVEPEFIICDESVAALDVSVQAQVLNLLTDLKAQRDLTYIFITHDFSVVNHVSNRIMVMNKGRVEEIGSTEEIVRTPKSDYTKKLISSILEIK